MNNLQQSTYVKRRHALTKGSVITGKGYVIVMIVMITSSKKDVCMSRVLEERTKATILTLIPILISMIDRLLLAVLK